MNDDPQTPLTLKLYGHDTSPYVRRIRVLLAEKGLPFQRDPASWSAPDSAAMQLNPLQRVPVLADEAPGGTTGLFDSKLIAAYLFDRYPQVAPAPSGMLTLQATLFHPEHRYEDENLLLILDGAVDSAINVFLLELDGIPRAQSPYIKRQVDRIDRCLRHIDARLAGRTTIHAGAFGFVDLALACHLDWLVFRDRYPVRTLPNLAAFLDAHAGRPSLESTHPRHAASAAPPKTPVR